MKFIRAFVSGIVLPSVILPIMILVAMAQGKSELICIPFFHFIPIIWGIWNVLYFAICIHCLPGNNVIKMLITGGVLGFLVALCGVFVCQVPELIGIPPEYNLWPLWIAPIAYAILWLVVVHPLNHLVGIKECCE